MTMDVMREGKPVPLRVVPAPTVTGTPGENAPAGTRTKAGLLGPLTMREKALVCAVADALGTLRERAERASGGALAFVLAPFELTANEKQGLLGLLVAFKDATGCAWTEAEWS